MSDATWLDEHLEDVQGRHVLITGGNSGIGLEAARILAGRGAKVMIACRSLDKGRAAVADIHSDHPAADVDLLELDLADLASVENAAAECAQRWQRLDILCNNAGVMALPYRQTVDGFEMQFGTNHFGHFALTAHLRDVLVASAARVVTVSSGMHRYGRPGLDNLDASKGYDKWRAYGTSKLANLRFTYELQRRATAAGSPVTATAAHPGYSHTNLQTAGPRMQGSRVGEVGMKLLTRVVSQRSARGALPTVYAAAGKDVRGGDYIGPSGVLELQGLPRKVGATAAARDPEAGRRLWEISEQMTGVTVEL